MGTAGGPAVPTASAQVSARRCFGSARGRRGLGGQPVRFCQGQKEAQDTWCPGQDQPRHMRGARTPSVTHTALPFQPALGSPER